MKRRPGAIINPAQDTSCPTLCKLIKLTHTGTPYTNRMAKDLVELKLLVKETGKLTGKFVVRMDLQPEAARKLAAELNQLADLADSQKPS